VISVKNLHMADAVGHERLVLTACTPRGSAQFRLVVEALPA
jgi:sortase (surface protein transpeptidase)